MQIKCFQAVSVVVVVGGKLTALGFRVHLVCIKTWKTMYKSKWLSFHL